MKTLEEIEALKKNWLSDPCWDIEETEGFEEHKAELLAFRSGAELTMKSAADKRSQKELEINTIAINALWASTDENHIEIMKIRALLALALQVKRLADAWGKDA